MRQPKKPYNPQKPQAPQKKLKVFKSIEFDSLFDRSHRDITLAELISKLPQYLDLDDIRIADTDYYYENGHYRVEYSIEEDNNCYNEETKAYEKKIRKYEKHLDEFNIKMKVYEKEKLEYDVWQKE